MNAIFRHCLGSALWKLRPFIESYARHLETEEPQLIGYFWNAWPEFLGSLLPSLPIWYIIIWYARISHCCSFSKSLTQFLLIPVERRITPTNGKEVSSMQSFSTNRHEIRSRRPEFQGSRRNHTVTGTHPPALTVKLTARQHNVVLHSLRGVLAMTDVCTSLKHLCASETTCLCGVL